MRVTYIGPHTEGVEIADGVVVAHGETVDVDDGLAAGLLAQEGSWAAADEPPARTRSRAAAKSED